MKAKLFILSLFVPLLGLAQVEFSFEEATKLPNTVNSSYEETAPVFDAKRQRLYFTRSLHPLNTGGKGAGQDIWYSEALGQSWSAASNDLPRLNNQLNNSVLGVHDSGDELYLLSTYIPKLSLQKGFAFSTATDNGWSKPKEFDLPSLHIKSDYYSGWVSEDGSMLIASMESKNSKGQEDLYISTKDDDGNWSKPIWMGDSLNSAGFEISPYLMSDGVTLLFASDGHGGMGSADIFCAYRKDSTWTNWTKPINLGPIINSAGFDAYAFPAGELVYFASNRGDTFSNIYSAINTSFYQLADTVHMAFRMNGASLPEAQVLVLDASGERVGTYYADDQGVLHIPNLRQKKSYQLVPSHPTVDIGLFQPYQLNSQGQLIAQLEIAEDGAITMKPQTPEDIAASPVVAEPTYVPGMHGLFELDGVPVRNVMMALRDSTGKVVQYARTNNKGRFGFAETDDKMTHSIQVVTDLEYLKSEGLVYYTDGKGMKLFRAKAIGGGAYTYQKLEAQEMAQLKMLSEMKDQEIQASKGVFKFQDLPKEGVTIYLVDENDNIVETVVTNAAGEFEFTKLDPDQNFEIRVGNEEDTELQADGLVYFMDANGNELNVLNAKRDGSGFQYRALRSDLAESLQLMEVEEGSLLAEKFVFSVGMFKYQNLPKEGVILRLLDENDNIVETVTTDEQGHFVFSMLKPDLTYKVQVVGMEDQGLSESHLYFVGKDGEVINAANEDENTFTFQELNPDYFFSVNQLNDAETELTITESFKDVVGQFKYKDLPKSGVKLYLLDENDKIVETVYTDENGNFIFKKLAKESNFYVRLSEEDMSLIDASSFVMMNENEEELVQEEVTEEGFSFRTLPRSDATLAGMGEGTDGGLDASNR